jgi:hypothetical protein
MSNEHTHDGIDTLAAAVDAALDSDRYPHAAACWQEIRRRIDDLAEAIGDLDGAVDHFMQGEPKPIQHVSIGHDGRLTTVGFADPCDGRHVVMPREAYEAIMESLPAEPCPDCDGTGWAAESNPGTGGGTGRDEQIACPCPRGCPEPTTAEIAAAIARGEMTLGQPDDQGGEDGRF